MTLVRGFAAVALLLLTGTACGNSICDLVNEGKIPSGQIPVDEPAPVPVPDAGSLRIQVYTTRPLDHPDSDSPGGHLPSDPALYR